MGFPTQSISVLWVVGWYLSFLFKFLRKQSVSNQWKPCSATKPCDILSGYALSHKNNTTFLYGLTFAKDVIYKGHSNIYTHVKPHSVKQSSG